MSTTISGDYTLTASTTNVISLSEHVLLDKRTDYK